MKETIYLAGPDVFLENASDVLANKKLKLEALGFNVYTPFDTQSYNPYNIARYNEQCIRECDIVLANVEPFRGTEPDSGTVYEIGYAIALGKVVITYNNPNDNYRERLETHDVFHEHVKFIPEQFGLRQNLMISSSCNEFDTFEDVLEYLKKG